MTYHRDTSGILAQAAPLSPAQPAGTTASPFGLRLARVKVRGIVQGVGFRPFVYQLATRHGLTGWVCNTSGEVRIEIEGSSDEMEAFLSELTAMAPPVSRVEDVSAAYTAPVGYTRFEIRSSVEEDGKYQLVSPDIATCGPCLAEVFDKDDRRNAYPFTNCTNCGPRFTIIEDIPYDRPRTTMRSFRMCPQCRREYDDPLDRRFHAQPNACPACGPQVELADGEGKSLSSGDPVSHAARLLGEGRIVAVKGLGGFLLACDATSEAAVERLRERKCRPFRPLAVMVSSVEEAGRHCALSAEEEATMCSPQCPIVLLSRLPESTIAEGVAPGLKRLGIMLPYTPLHHLLLRNAGVPLVMTSGNLSEEPIAKDNEEALRRLSGIADAFLLHNRDIYSRYDDSVATHMAGERRLLRRARGYAPDPLRLPFAVPQVLACGAELKNTFCLTRDAYAFLSQHIGDMENTETLDHFETTIDLYRELFRIEPEIIACDMHPDYLATRYGQRLAAELGLPFVEVQHHHAHIASCLAENGFTGQAIGVAFDGSGYGDDGTVWGGEFLVADFRGFRRVGCLECVPLPGGAACIRKPYRMALAYLLALLGEEALGRCPSLRAVDPSESAIIRRMVKTGCNSPLTSSCGRLFDAVSALIGVRGTVEYEAQAAIELETLAADAGPAGSTAAYPFDVEGAGGSYVVRLASLFGALLSDLGRGAPVSEIAARFHDTMVEIIVRVCRSICIDTGIRTVALSGGVFQNRLLFERSVRALHDSGLKVLSHRSVPCNDGGISLGQAVIAAERSR